MVVHVLNGDALAGTLKRSGIHAEVIICRECLIDGPVANDDPVDFSKERAAFIHSNFCEPEQDYYQMVKPEFDKINSLQPDDEVFLWFEHDLFCQANMWFVISLLQRNRIRKAYRVSPLARLTPKWEGFGHHNPEDLKTCLSNRIAFDAGDFKLGGNLWDAYRKGDIEGLKVLSGSLSPCFPRLDEVCHAEVERKRHKRPEKTLRDILSHGYSDFSEIFIQFSKREAIYGFGDLQVSQMVRQLKVNS